MTRLPYYFISWSDIFIAEIRKKERKKRKKIDSDSSRWIFQAGGFNRTPVKWIQGQQINAALGPVEMAWLIADNSDLRIRRWSSAVRAPSAASGRTEGVGGAGGWGGAHTPACNPFFCRVLEAEMCQRVRA